VHAMLAPKSSFAFWPLMWMPVTGGGGAGGDAGGGDTGGDAGGSGGESGGGGSDGLGGVGGNGGGGAHAIRPAGTVVWPLSFRPQQSTPPSEARTAHV
jgi:hypothetical protein